MKIYVAGNVSRSGDGSLDHPFMTISEAADKARPGDTVVVAPGIYREWVKPRNSGTEDKRITYLSTEHGGAVITGSEEIKGWEAFENVWRVRIPNSYFGDYNPFTTLVHGDWFIDDPKNPSHTGEIYLNKRSMLEVFDLSFCMHPQKDNRSWEPDYTEYVWYTAQEDNFTVIYANFGQRPQL